MSSLTLKLAAQKRLALVAHDNMKDDLLEWAAFNLPSLLRHKLYATGTTGSVLSKHLNLEITALMSGPLGGDQQIGAKIAEGEIDMLIFFWDPLEAQPHDPDIRALLRMAAVWNIPIATTRSTADFLISSPLMDKEYERQVVNYSGYTGRLNE
jgi:methylglyoxal synthase